MGASPKGVVGLSDGREIAVDVSTLTVREWRSLWNPAAPDEDVDRLLSRLTGQDVAVFLDMLRDDYRRVFQKVVDLSNRPLDNPNSPGAST